MIVLESKLVKFVTCVLQHRNCLGISLCCIVNNTYFFCPDILL